MLVTLSGIKADVGSYEESGAFPVNLKVGSQDATSLTTNLGASLGYAFSTRYGVLEPDGTFSFVRFGGAPTVGPPEKPT